MTPLRGRPLVDPLFLGVAIAIGGVAIAIITITHPVASALEPKPKAIAAKIELFPVPFSPPTKLISAQDAPVSLADGRRSLSWQARGYGECARGTLTSSM